MADSDDNQRGAGLPASIEAAWGLRGRPAKGPKPGLSLERIVAAAVRVADTDGLAAVSMSRVAAELGTGPMSLYRYVSAKDELLTLMTDTAYGPPPDELAPGRGWRAGMHEWAWLSLCAMRVHPWVLRIPITGPPLTPNIIGWLERGLECMRDTGLAEGEKMSVILLISGYARNEATISAQVDGAAAASDLTMDQVMSFYGRALREVADPLRFPALHRVLASGVMDRADNPDDEFFFGLERILDGVEALVRARSESDCSGSA